MRGGEQRIVGTGTAAVGIDGDPELKHAHGVLGILDAMIVAFSVAPTVTPTADAEMADAVTEAVRVVRESGLPNETNAMFTLVEGEWDEVMAVIKRATDAVVAVSPRVSLVIKADIRPGHAGQITQKVESVETRLRADNQETGK